MGLLYDMSAFCDEITTYYAASLQQPELDHDGMIYRIDDASGRLLKTELENVMDARAVTELMTAASFVLPFAYTFALRKLEHVTVLLNLALLPVYSNVLQASPVLTRVHDEFYLATDILRALATLRRKLTKAGVVVHFPQRTWGWAVRCKNACVRCKTRPET
jgi:hypothetical protein